MPTTPRAKTALTIAGSDSCGGAGIQADLKVFAVLGVYGMSALTAVTAQNTVGVSDALLLAPDLIAKQVDVAAADVAVDACKTGMLGSAEIVRTVAAAIERNRLVPYVCDPVMYAKSGDALLLADDAVAAVRQHLLPLAAVATPNRREAARLAGLDPRAEMTPATAKDAARRIADAGARAVVVKGIASAGRTVDVLYDGQEFHEFDAETHPGGRTHGSGCAFSAAITAGLATGMPLIEAIAQAKRLVSLAIEHSDGQGRGTAPVNVLAWLRQGGER